MKTAILIALLLFTSEARKAEPPSLDTFYVIRVGLERQASGQVIYVASQGGGLHWIDPDTGNVVVRSNGQAPAKLQIQGDQLKLSDPNSQVQSRRLVVEPEEGAMLLVGTDPKVLKPFRGTLEWVRKNEGLLTVNWVRLDDYLKAVLPSEVPASFHPEALKAQAIAARSYTMRRLNRHRDSGYDLCDGDHCQIYRGVQSERKTTNMAVEATNGQVLVNKNGQVIEAVYSSDCGGHTAANETAGLGKNPVPYLRGIPDWDIDGRRYCSLSPRTAWEHHVDSKTLSGLFPQLVAIQEMKVIQRTPAGHALKVELTGKSGKQIVAGSELRAKLGASRLRSLMITMEKQADGWLVRGRGAGHGVGMCQWGAQGRALAGQTYEQILQAYYPGTSLHVP